MNKALKETIILLLIVTFLKGLTWSFFIPLWHFPDEQAHFAHVEYLAEGGRPPIGRGLDLSEEIFASEKILGTKRDSWGNNKFTYHPEYNIEYSDNLIGLYEEEIKNLPKSTRSNFIKQEAATYPHFFYQISGLIYHLFYGKDLFVRVFTLRVFWLFSLLGIIWLSFLLTKEIFPKNYFFQITLPILVSFQSMFTFVSSGVTIDNFVNLLFTLVLYLSVLLIKKACLSHLVFLIIILILGIANKNNFLIAFGVIIFPLSYIFLKKKKLILKSTPFLALFILIAYFFNADIRNTFIIFLSGKIPFFDFKTLAGLEHYSIWDHLFWTIRHLIAEVLPWYWGVFRWLSMVLPRWVNRIMMRILVVSLIGLLIKVVLIIKGREFNKKNLLFTFVLYSALIYFLALFVWDWHFFRGNGYSFGMQGRYYFPVIILHMILLAVGLETFFISLLDLFKKILKIRKPRINFSLFAFRFSLCFWFIFLNCIAFYVVTASYYDASNLNTFIVQASQYKPWFAKGWWLVALLTAYLLSLLIFIFKLANVFILLHHEK